MGTKLHLDLESRSALDLRKRGLDLYSRDLSTAILMCGFVFGDEDVDIFYPPHLPPRIYKHVLEGGEVHAFNASFEIAMWNEIGVKRYGWPILRVTQCACTQARAYAMSLPGSLDNAAAALGLKIRKDSAGHRLMLQLSKPKEVNEDGIIWYEEAEKFNRLADYCRKDVEVERELAKRLLHLSGSEKRLWGLDQLINSRGIPVDVRSIEKAIAIVDAEKERLDKEMREVTGNYVGACTNVGQLKDFFEFQGFPVEGVGKAELLGLLSKKDLPPLVKRAAELRQEAGKSSTSKLEAMRNRASHDGRCRGTLQYHGASTGRFSGRGIQIQNFKRTAYGTEDTDKIFDLLHGGYPSDALGLFFGPPLDVISSVLRSFICASPHHTLLWCDFSSIEARVIAWLAGEEKVLQAFREGKDIYIVAAARIFRVPIESITRDDPRRQIGKIAVLALGFGGGKKAFAAMAKNLGVNISEEEAEKIKIAWREAHPKIVEFWRCLEASAMAAVLNPGVECPVGRDGKITFKKSGSFLFCKLPSGRLVTYPYPKLEPVETPWGEMKDALTYMAVDSVSGKWERQKSYGGLLAENVTQAVARDLLSEALLRLEQRHYTTVFHVHDEIVCEEEIGQRSVEEMESIVKEVPPWAVGLPIEVKVEEGRRYSK